MKSLNMKKFDGLPDEALISDSQARLLVGTTSMSSWRWTKAGKFPPMVDINGRNFRRAGELRKFLKDPQNYRAEH